MFCTIPASSRITLLTDGTSPLRYKFARKSSFGGCAVGVDTEAFFYLLSALRFAPNRQTAVILGPSGLLQ